MVLEVSSSHAKAVQSKICIHLASVWTHVPVECPAHSDQLKRQQINWLSITREIRLLARGCCVGLADWRHKSLEPLRGSMCMCKACLYMSSTYRNLTAGATREPKRQPFSL